MNRLIIIGAGGHGKVIADIAIKNGYTDIGFLDDHVKGECMGFPVVGKSADAEKFNDSNTDFIIGIGNNAVRKIIDGKYDINWATLIHPSARISVNVSVEKGTVVMAGAVINACAEVGRHCIVNSNSVVEHDNVIGNYVHISPGATLGGTVKVGESTHIGIGAAVKNNISICSQCVIGAGAVVVSDIDVCGTYMGVPARMKKI